MLRDHRGLVLFTNGTDSPVLKPSLSFCYCHVAPLHRSWGLSGDGRRKCTSRNPKGDLEVIKAQLPKWTIGRTPSPSAGDSSASCTSKPFPKLARTWGGGESWRWQKVTSPFFHNNTALCTSAGTLSAHAQSDWHKAPYSGGIKHSDMAFIMESSCPTSKEDSNNHNNGGHHNGKLTRGLTPD